MLVHRATEAEDLTRNKNDDTDAVIIARLALELRCYLPERADPGWARLRHLGARRIELVTVSVAAGQQIRDLLECAWPAVWGAAVEPLESASSRRDDRRARPDRHHRRSRPGPPLGLVPGRRGSAP
jgi:hypothetical protein